MITINETSKKQNHAADKDHGIGKAAVPQLSDKGDCQHSSVSRTISKKSGITNFAAAKLFPVIL